MKCRFVEFSQRLKPLCVGTEFDVSEMIALCCVSGDSMSPVMWSKKVMVATMMAMA